MKPTRSFKIGLLILIFLGVCTSTACNQRPAVSTLPPQESPIPTLSTKTPAAVANPASVFCLEQGGTLEIRQGEIGQYGVCLFSDGTECEEWDYYKGYCQPGQVERAADPGRTKSRSTATRTLDQEESAEQAGVTESPTASAPAPGMAGEPFLPTVLTPLTPDNIGEVGIVAELDAPHLFWTAFSPDGQLLATIFQRPQERDWQVQVWDLNSGQPLFTVPGGPIAFFSSDSSSLAVMSLGQGFKIFDSERGSANRFIDFPGVVALAPDYSSLTTSQPIDSASGRSTIAVVDAGLGTKLHEFVVDGTVVDARYSPDSSLLVITTGGTTSEASFWDLTSDQQVASLTEVDRITFAPGGQEIAALIGTEKEIHLLETNGLQDRLILDNSAGPQALELAYSFDGRILAAALGNAVRFWDTDTGEEITTIPVQASNISFAPDSTLLLTSNYQGEVKFWAVVP